MNKLNNKVVYWLVPILYIVFGAKLVAAMGFSGDIAPAMAYKVGFATLLMALLLMSNKVKTVGLNLSVNLRVLPLFWPFAVLIIFTLSRPTASPSMMELLQLLLFTLSIGFIEEVVFRGLIFHWLAKHSKVKIVLLSSVIFGLFHGLNILSGDDIRVVGLQVFVAFSIGLVFAVIRMKDSSILSVIVVHALIDFSEYAANGMSSSTEFNEQTVVMWLVPGVVFFVWGLVLLYRMDKTVDLEAAESVGSVS